MQAARRAMMSDGRELADEDLTAHALEGRREAWDVLIARHHQRVLLLLLARGVRVDRAKDIAQETWARLIAHQRAGRLERLELPGLALRQAIYLSLEEGRRSRREVAIDDELAYVRDPAPSMEDRLVARAQLARASAELDRCPARAQTIFELTYDDPGVPHAVAARRLGSSVQRVRQTICEVRARLRAALEDDKVPLAFASARDTELPHD